MHFRKTASELWLLLQLTGPIGLQWQKACKQHSFITVKIAIIDIVISVASSFFVGSE